MKTDNYVEICHDFEYKERYFIYLAKRLYERFYQDMGFIVLPKAQLKTPVEVVFPRIVDFLNDPRAKKLFTMYSASKNFSLLLDKSAYKKLKFWDTLQHTLKTEVKSYEEKTVLDFFERHKVVFLDFAASYGVNVKTFKLKLVPVHFGTSKTFSYHALSNTLLITWRKDLKDNLLYLIEGFVSGFVSSEVRFEDRTTFNSKHGWYEREAICDYLTIRMLYKLGLKDEVSKFKKTVDSLKSAHKYTKQRQESDKYLAELGFLSGKQATISNVQIKNRVLNLGEKRLNLTEMESKFISALISSFPYAASFDEIASSLWGDDAEKFSLQALARIQSNLRLKLKTLGYEHLLSTLRGSGVLLNIDSID